MIEEAGAAGAEVTVWGNTTIRPQGDAGVCRAAQKLGFNATVKILDGGVYFQTVGNEETAAGPVSSTGSRTSRTRDVLLPGRRRHDPADQQPEQRLRRRPERSTTRSTELQHGAGPDGGRRPDWAELDNYLVD